MFHALYEPFKAFLRLSVNADKISIQLATCKKIGVCSMKRLYGYITSALEMADRERNTEVKTVADLLDEIEDETLYRALLTVDRRTLQIILLKMQGYSTKEIAPLVGLTTGAIYARLDHLRKKLRKIL